jgi:hypothetical protein
MNRKTTRKALTAAFLLALVVSESKRTAGDSSRARHRNSAPAHASQNAQGSPSEREASGSPGLASQTPTAPANAPPEIILRDGTVTKGDPSQVDRSQVSTICFPDCIGAPPNDSDTDLIVLKDGQRNLQNLEELDLGHNFEVIRNWNIFGSIEAGSDTALEGLKVFMGNNYLKLKDQERLRKRFPKVVFDFENEYDDNSEDANEEPPERPGPEVRF